MNYWILQNRQQQNQTLAQQLAGVKGYHWNITSSFRQVQSDDLVLLWQAHKDENVRGIHAWGRVARDPYLNPDAEREWKVDITDIHVLSRLLSAHEIERSRIPQLLELSIMKKGQQRSRRVHRITASDWEVLQRLRPKLL